MAHGGCAVGWLLLGSIFDCFCGVGSLWDCMLCRWMVVTFSGVATCWQAVMCHSESGPRQKPQSMNSEGCQYAVPVPPETTLAYNSLSGITRIPTILLPVDAPRYSRPPARMSMCSLSHSLRDGLLGCTCYLQSRCLTVLAHVPACLSLGEVRSAFESIILTTLEV